MTFNSAGPNVRDTEDALKREVFRGAVSLSFIRDRDRY